MIAALGGESGDRRRVGLRRHAARSWRPGPRPVAAPRVPRDGDYRLEAGIARRTGLDDHAAGDLAHPLLPAELLMRAEQVEHHPWRRGVVPADDDPEHVLVSGDRRTLKAERFGRAIAIEVEQRFGSQRCDAAVVRHAICAQATVIERRIRHHLAPLLGQQGGEIESRPQVGRAVGTPERLVLECRGRLDDHQA